MAKLQFRCPHCRGAVRASASEAGSSGRCPSCGHVFTIPTPAAQGAEQAVGSIAATAASETPQRSSTPAANANAWSGAIVEARPPLRQSPARQGETRVVHLIDRLVAAISLSNIRRDSARAYSRAASSFASYAVLVTGMLYAVVLVISAAKADSMSVLIIAAVVLLGAFVLHYLAARFAHLAGQLTHGREAVYSPVLSHTVALLSALGAVGVLVSGLTAAIRTSSLTEVWLTLIPLVVLLHIAVCSANPAAFLHLREDSRTTVDAVLTSFGEFGCRLILALGWIVLLAAGPVAAVWMAVSAITFLVHGGGLFDYFSMQTAASAGAVAALCPLFACLLYVGLRAVLAVLQSAFVLAGRESRSDVIEPAERT